MIDTSEVTAGDRFRLDYVASDADSDFQSAQFRFRHETTGNYIYLNDSDDDGIAFYNSNKSLENGTYNLNEIQLYDTASNRIEFNSSGSTGTWNSQGHKSGTHTIDFSKYAFNVTASDKPNNQQQTDFTPPELISMVTFGTDHPLSLIHI